MGGKKERMPKLTVTTHQPKQDTEILRRLGSFILEDGEDKGEEEDQVVVAV